MSFSLSTPLLFLTWDPDPTMFTLPFVDWPILWYGFFFAFGFALAFPLFVRLLIRYFFNFPDYVPVDILVLRPGEKGREEVAAQLNQKMESEGALWEAIPYQREVRGSGCFDFVRGAGRLFLDQKLTGFVLGLKKKALSLSDRLMVYVVAATLIGARLGHFLFYENPSDYLNNPLELFMIRQGGLASHGAALAIIFALLLFSRKIKKEAQGLSTLRLLDLVSIPAALVGGWIRIGNFFNQEILGTPTDLPWGVLFGHPRDGDPLSPLVARHPVQLYEAFFYFAVFTALWRLSFRPATFLKEGRIFALFLLAVFGFRIFIEHLKVEQSHLLVAKSLFTMGQYLSVPLVLLGMYVYWKTSRER